MCILLHMFHRKRRNSSSIDYFNKWVSFLCVFVTLKCERKPKTWKGELRYENIIENVLLPMFVYFFFSSQTQILWLTVTEAKVGEGGGWCSTSCPVGHCGGWQKGGRCGWVSPSPIPQQHFVAALFACWHPHLQASATGRPQPPARQHIRQNTRHQRRSHSPCPHHKHTHLRRWKLVGQMWTPCRTTPSVCFRGLKRPSSSMGRWWSRYILWHPPSGLEPSITLLWSESEMNFNPCRVFSKPWPLTWKKRTFKSSKKRKKIRLVLIP